MLFVKCEHNHFRLVQVPTSSWETDTDAVADGLLGGKAPVIGPDPAIIGVTRQSGSEPNTVLTPNGSSGQTKFAPELATARSIIIRQNLRGILLFAGTLIRHISRACSHIPRDESVQRPPPPRLGPLPPQVTSIGDHLTMMSPDCRSQWVPVIASVGA